MQLNLLYESVEYECMYVYKLSQLEQRVLGIKNLKIHFTIFLSKFRPIDKRLTDVKGIRYSNGLVSMKTIATTRTANGKSCLKMGKRKMFCIDLFLL